MNALKTNLHTLDRGSPVDAGKQFVFRSGRLWFSVPAIAVREVTIAPAWVQVPGCHSSLAGLCHIRSEFIPVVALEELLDIDGIRPTERQDKLVILSGRVTCAIRVAEAAALESLETLIAPELRHEDGNPNLILGTAMFRDQIVRVLDPNAVLRLAQKSLEESWQHATASF